MAGLTGRQDDRGTGVVCGTGYADGTATITALAGGDVGEGATTVTYSIVFVGTVGIITGTANEGNSGQSWVAGLIQIRAFVSPPTPGAVGQGPCSTAFTPTGRSGDLRRCAAPSPVHPCTDADDVVASGVGGWPLADPFSCLPLLP